MHVSTFSSDLLSYKCYVERSSWHRPPVCDKHDTVEAAITIIFIIFFLIFVYS